MNMYFFVDYRILIYVINHCMAYIIFRSFHNVFTFLVFFLCFSKWPHINKMTIMWFSRVAGKPFAKMAGFQGARSWVARCLSRSDVRHGQGVQVLPWVVTWWVTPSIPVAPCQFREFFSHGIVKEEQGKFSGEINKIEKLNLLVHGELFFRQFQGVGV